MYLFIAVENYTHFQIHWQQEHEVNSQSYIAFGFIITGMC